MPAYSRKLSRGVRWFFSGQYLGEKYHSKAMYHTKGECLKAERERLQELDRKQRYPNKMMLLDLINNRLDYLQLNKSKDYYKENIAIHFQNVYSVSHSNSVEEIFISIP